MTLHHGDCLEVMAGMEAESVDAIVTDPPYNLTAPLNWGTLGDSPERTGLRPKGRTSSERQTGGFMGKAWDGTGIAFQREMWEAAYRVAKPSAYLLAFGGTRTVHRMTVALEDAGWIIRDMLVWAYASGFPKSKASLKPAWEPIVLARKPGPLRMLAIDECRIGYASDADKATSGTFRPAYDDPNTTYDGTKGTVAFGGGALRADRESAEHGRWPANVILTDPIFDGGIEGVVGGGETTTGALRPYHEHHDSPTSYRMERDKTYLKDQDTGTYSRFFLIPKSDRSDREPAIYPFCACETVKLGAWQRQGRSQPAPMASTSRAKGISEATSEADYGSPTTLFGSSTSDPSPLDSKSITSTETSRTTGSPTSKPSIPSPINDSTPAARSSTASGGNGAASASSTDPSTPSGGTSHEKAGPSTGAAGHATSARSSRPSVCAECGKEVMPSRAARINAHPT